ncbi:MAG: VanZ family protein [Planctomycetota bacterium]|nr:VanZ family protein [Planctomycetota bacterium]
MFARLRAVHPGIGAALLCAWMVLIWTLSAQPPSDLSQGSHTGAWVTNLAHAPEYAGLALWLALAVRRPGADVAPTARAAFWILAFCVLHGAVDELHQGTVPGRDASAFDVLTDLCGAASAVSVLRAAHDRRKFALAILIGIAACIAAAGLATFVPRMAPEITWL